MNMSYCKYHNTSLDLEDCVGSMELDNINELSQSELNGLIKILELSEYIQDIKEDIIVKLQKV